MIREEDYRGAVYSDTTGAGRLLPIEVNHVDVYGTTGTAVFVVQDARYFRVGKTISFVKHNASNIVVQNQDSDVIGSFSTANTMFRIVLTDNTSAGGTWRVLPELAINTAATLNHNRGTEPAQQAQVTPLSVSCPRYFVLTNCDDAAEIITTTDFLEYLGRVVTISEQSGCWIPQVYDGPEPSASDIVTTTYTNDVEFCTDPACDPCGVWGLLNDFAETTPIGSVDTTYSAGSWSCSISRNTGATETVTAGIPNPGIDLSDIEAITIQFDVTMNRFDHVLQMTLFGDDQTTHVVNITVEGDISDVGVCPILTKSVAIRLERSDVAPANWVVVSGPSENGCSEPDVSALSFIDTDDPGNGPGFDFDEWRISIQAFCEISCPSNLGNIAVTNLQVCWEEASV